MESGWRRKKRKKKNIQADVWGKFLYLGDISSLNQMPMKENSFSAKSLALSQELAQVKVISRAYLVFGLCRN